MSSMSNYMKKGKSSNFASASTAFASETMTTPTLTRTRSIIPNAPYKAPHSLHRGVEQGEQGELSFLPKETIELFFNSISKIYFKIIC